MKVGGPADYFAEVETVEQLKEVLAFIKEKKLKYMIVGRGSNTLFDDLGFKGLIILNKINHLDRTDKTHISVGSGYSFSLLGTQTARWGLTGLEFASGIPGSVGGAIYMNAGANGKETADCLYSVTVMSQDGDVKSISRSDMTFSYRTSCFHNRDVVIIGATFQLEDEPHSRRRQIEIIKKRQATQPLNEPSSGCMFRNPEGSHSGALIEQCGLKGKRIGGAVVSPLHANFIINTGSATSDDVRQLANFIKQTVKEKTGQELHMEVRQVPYE